MAEFGIQPRDALPGGARLVAARALMWGAVLMAMKFAIFALTNSAAVLSDALESIVNLVAAAVALASTWYAARPPDRDHPYGHGNVEFIAVAVEGLMVALAGALIAFEAVRRLVSGAEPRHLDVGVLLLAGVAVLLAILAGYVWRSGVRLESPTLVADGKHLLTDVVTTLGVVFGLLLVQLTGRPWLDPLLAIIVAVVIFFTGWRLICQSWRGLMDRIDDADDAAIRSILDDAVSRGDILGYHKVRHRHQGSFHWVDMHIHVPGELTVRAAHDVASALEYRIETHLGRANATAHIEPPQEETDANFPSM
jgi:cation diffusion facilitator family transporter